MSPLRNALLSLCCKQENLEMKYFVVLWYVSSIVLCFCFQIELIITYFFFLPQIATNVQENCFSSIPNDLLLHIFATLDSKSLHTARAVCRKWERLVMSVRLTLYNVPKECTDEQLLLILEIFPLLQKFCLQSPVRYTPSFLFSFFFQSASLRLSMTTWALINSRDIPIVFPTDRSKVPTEFLTWLVVLRSQLHINNLFETELCVLNSLLVLEDESRQANLLGLRAWVYSFLNKVPEGLKDIEAQRKLRPQMSLFEIKVLATLLSKAGRHAEAVATFSSLLDSEHNDVVKASILAARATIYSRALNHETALRDLEQAITIDPSFTAAWQVSVEKKNYCFQPLPKSLIILLRNTVTS
jgi:hypothetical protein